MAVPFLKVCYTPPGGSRQDITEFTNVQNKRGLQMKDAKMDISINNSKYRYKTGGEPIFTPDGDFEIYADYEPITFASSQLLLSGQVQELSQSMSEGGMSTKLSISDKTTLLLSGVWGKNYTTQKVDEIIKNVIQSAPSAQGLVTINNVASTRTDASAFPVYPIGKSMKPVIEWISDLSQPSVTGEDRAYLFYVDKDNDLHWFYPEQTTSGSIVEGTDEIYSASFKKSQDELVNMVIYNAGQDLRGNGNLWYEYNMTSKSNKLRMKFQPMIDIGRDLFKQEISAGNLVEVSDGSFHYQGKQYNRNGTVIPSWPNATAVSSDSDYNEAFREAQRVVARKQATSYMNAFAGLKWKGSIELKGSNSYVAGDFLSIQLPTLGIPVQAMRVWDVQQSFGNDGWITTLELREDDQAITEES